jgi:DNA-binding response OmpR family regulator
MHNKQILYIEDDLNLGFVTRYNLESRNYKVLHCDNGRKALELFIKENISLCLLDVMLPEMDGFTLASEIRKINADVPIIFLTAKSLSEDKIYGLTLGADDYITKPYHLEELILKIEIFLKRSQVQRPVAACHSIGSFSFDFNNLSLQNGNESCQLTLKEAELLQFFCRNKNKIVKREDILNSVWGNDDYFLGRSLDVFISRLRKYLNSDKTVKIENVHSIGFRMKVEA